MLIVILIVDLNFEFNQVEIAVYGDDSLVCVDRPDVSYYDLVFYFEHRFGITYTHHSKTSVGRVCDTLADVGYLGRTFVPVGDHYHCPLPLHRVDEICMYFQSSEDDGVVLLSMFSSMAEEYAQFPRDIFEERISLLLASIGKIRPDLLSFARSRIQSYEMYQITYSRDLSRIGSFDVDESRCDSGIIPQSNRITHISCSNYAEPKSMNAVSDTRNEDKTAKAVNELASTQDVQLGSYMDAAPVTVTSTNDAVFQVGHQNNNMEVFDLNRVLDREYLLGNYSWTTAAAAGAVIATFDFPRVLFAQTFISNKIQDYSYFRAGIRFTVRIAASSFLYGRLLVNYVPRPGWNQYQAQSTNIFTGSGYPHMLPSASASEAAVLDVPFISPHRAISTDTGETNEMGRFQIIVLNPLKDINGAVGSANIAVTAQFLDAEIWMPKDVIVPQSKVIEARKKSAAQTVSNAQIASRSIQGKVAITKQRNVYKDMFTSAIEAAGTALELGAILGMDKPTTVESVKPVKVTAVSDYANGRGMSTCTKFSMDPENSVATTPVTGGVNADEMDLNYICGTPMLVSSTAMLSGTAATKIMTTSPYDTNMTYVDFVTRHFKYFSGGYKFKCYITASTLHSVKLVFWLNNSAVLTAWQDCYHQIVDVQGDTEVEFAVPYIAKNFCRSIDDTDNFGIWVQTLSWSQPVPAASTPIYLNVYKAADSDMEFGCHIEREFVVQSNPRADFAKAFKPFHESFGAYNHEGIIWGEKYRSLSDILHKQHAYYLNATASTKVWSKDFIGASSLYGLEMWGLLFQYYRGSIRITGIRNENQNAAIFGYIDGQPIPGLDMSYGTKPVLEAEFPFYSFASYWPTTLDPANVLSFAFSDTSYLTKSAGEDFRFLFLSPPPNGQVRDVNNAANGLKGLKAYMTAAP